MLSTADMTPEEFAIFAPALQTTLIKAYTEMPAPLVDALALKVDLNGTDTAVYGAISQMPGMHKLVGTPQYRDWAHKAFSVKCDPYTSRIRAKRQDVEYARQGVMTARLNQWMMTLKMHVYEMCIALLMAGKTTLTFDGKALFANDHPNGVGGTNDNLLALTGATLANFKTDLDLVDAALRGFIPFAQNADDARKQNTALTHVLVSPSMARIAREALTNPYVSAGVVNTYYGMIPPENIIVDSNWSLTSASSWLGFALPPQVDKPFVYQESKPLSVDIIGPGTEHYRINDEYLFIANAEREVAPLNPLCVVAVDG